MKEFSIITDSCCDLPLEFIENNKIPYVSLTCSYNGIEHKDNFGKNLPFKRFFEDLREGKLPNTSQPNSTAFYEVYKKELEQGKNIIYICVSSGLSGTLNSANIAKNMIIEEFPGAKIEIIDILTASLGQGLMVIKAYEMKNSGKTFEDIVKYLKDNTQRLNTYITVDDLNHLKRGGRISSTAAVIGGILHIKPILTINHEGKVMPVLKVKGRKKSINVLVEIIKERIENSEEQTIAICHGDCEEEALKLKELILNSIKVKDVVLNYIGPVVGTHGGPGALAIFFMGKDRQHHMIDRA